MTVSDSLWPLNSDACMFFFLQENEMRAHSSTMRKSFAFVVAQIICSCHYHFSGPQFLD